MGPNHHHHRHSHRNIIEEVCPIKGATLVSHGIAPVLVISILTQRSGLFRNRSSSLIQYSPPSHHTQSGYVITFTIVKVVSTLTESMPYVDSGLFNNQRLHLSHRSVLLYLIKVRFDIKISSSGMNPIYIQTNKIFI